MIRRRLTITGKVQNVFYRDWLVEQAAALGIDGWVRNRADGSVEAVAEGASEMVEAIVDRARQGSPASRVADVTVSDDAPADRLEGFVKRPTV
ncbi:acylphosphatase [Hephaestia mangrovi]|uniref:acylphosphatase n=1 Tax=Hephaestia mangrovi TaxID=2873268 RepID=UPI001CA707CB|nr:acylphosphatase [Hephaestia mangrovi]MBY8829120.1 acylphosphatase [Hephaestia mangrovi]